MKILFPNMAIAAIAGLLVLGAFPSGMRPADRKPAEGPSLCQPQRCVEQDRRSHQLHRDTTPARSHRLHPRYKGAWLLMANAMPDCFILA